jgi:hypothetical protein
LLVENADHLVFILVNLEAAGRQGAKPQLIRAARWVILQDLNFKPLER